MCIHVPLPLGKFSGASFAAEAIDVLTNSQLFFFLGSCATETLPTERASQCYPGRFSDFSVICSDIDSHFDATKSLSTLQDDSLLNELEARGSLAVCLYGQSIHKLS